MYQGAIIWSNFPQNVIGVGRFRILEGGGGQGLEYWGGGARFRILGGGARFRILGAKV